MKWEGPGEKDVPKYTGLTERSGLPWSPACPSDSQTSKASVLNSHVGEEKPDTGPEVWPGQRLNHSASWKGKLGAWEVCFEGFYHQLGKGSLGTLLIHLGPGSFTFHLYSERIKHSPSWRVKECLAPGFPLRILSICDCSRHLENLKSATKRGAESVPTFNAFSKGSVGRTRREGLDAVLSCLFLDFTFTNCEISQLLCVTSGGTGLNASVLSADAEVGILPLCLLTPVFPSAMHIRKVFICLWFRVTRLRKLSVSGI